jgi:Zn-finger protein
MPFIEAKKCRRPSVLCPKVEWMHFHEGYNKVIKKITSVQPDEPDEMVSHKRV